MSRIFRISQGFSLTFVISPENNESGALRSFYADVSELSRRKPAISLRAGFKGDAAAPVVAVCHMPGFYQNFKIGLGDPTSKAGEASMRWEDMRSQNRSCTVYGFTAAGVTAPELAGQTLVWKHTRRVMVDGEPGSAAFRAQSWKLVDEGGRVLVVFTGAKVLRHPSQCGRLQINVDWGNDFETMVLTMCLTLYEKERREVIAASAS